MIGRAGSRGFPGKNTTKILGRSICEYPLIAAKKSKFINKIFISTDCPKIEKIGRKYTKNFIKRPKYSNDERALVNDRLEKFKITILKVVHPFKFNISVRFEIRS